MLRPFFVSIFIAVSTCSSIICGAACDWQEPGECFGPTGLFGPCINHECIDGLECFSGLAGEMCVQQARPTPEAEACASWVGGTGFFTAKDLWGVWLIGCDSDADCDHGTVCEENIGACLHPYIDENVKPPPGAGLGPCTTEYTCGYHLDECFVASNGSGTICARPDRPEWLAACSKVEPDCPNGQVCATDDEVCVWPK